MRLLGSLPTLVALLHGPAYLARESFFAQKADVAFRRTLTLLTLLRSHVFHALSWRSADSGVKSPVSGDSSTAGTQATGAVLPLLSQLLHLAAHYAALGPGLLTLMAALVLFLQQFFVAVPAVAAEFLMEHLATLQLLENHCPETNVGVLISALARFDRGWLIRYFSNRKICQPCVSRHAKRRCGASRGGGSRPDGFGDSPARKNDECSGRVPAGTVDEESCRLGLTKMVYFYF
jgi:hypothetical protein